MEKRDNGRRHEDKYKKSDISDFRQELIDHRDELSSRIKEVNDALEKLLSELRSYRESGLPEILKEYNDQKVFIARSEKYAMRTLWVAKFITGIIAALVALGGITVAIIQIMKNGVGPTGTP